jgi:hypothetical protein
MIILIIRFANKLVNNNGVAVFNLHIFLPATSLSCDDDKSDATKFYHHRWKAKNQADR